jgi:hypothetical protein
MKVRFRCDFIVDAFEGFSMVGSDVLPARQRFGAACPLDVEAGADCSKSELRFAKIGVAKIENRNSKNRWMAQMAVRRGTEAASARRSRFVADAAFC